MAKEPLHLMVKRTVQADKQGKVVSVTTEYPDTLQVQPVNPGHDFTPEELSQGHRKIKAPPEE